jgi:hypothetical protein
MKKGLHTFDVTEFPTSMRQSSNEDLGTNFDMYVEVSDMHYWQVGNNDENVFMFFISPTSKF